MKADRDTFGPQLRRERERRGITLKGIAASTKIKESLFADLERGDFSKWPQGIFRRAHLCAYVSAMGLPSQPILAEFWRLFPEEHPDAQTDRLKANEAIESLPAGPGVMPTRHLPCLADRTWIVFFDVAAVCLISSIVAGIVGMSLWSAVAFVGLGYSATGSACFAQSIGGYVQHWIHALVQSRRAPQPASAPRGEVRLIASRPDRGSPAGRDMNQEREVHQRRASA